MERIVNRQFHYFYFAKTDSLFLDTNLEQNDKKSHPWENVMEQVPSSSN